MTTNDFIGDKTKERDRFELELSDTLDVKASIVALVLTFLGTIAATILTADRASTTAKLAQFPVIAGVAVSWIFCVVCLRPRVYLLDDLPETYANALPGVGQTESERLERITSISIELANGRIGHNYALNATKTRALNRAFWSCRSRYLSNWAPSLTLRCAIRPS